MQDVNENRRGYKKTKVGWIPEEWACERVGDVTRSLSGGTPSKSDPSFWNGNISWYSAKDLKRFYLPPAQDKVTEEGIKSGSTEVPSNTILVLVRGMMLNRDFPVCLTTSRACFNQDIRALIPYDSINPKYLAYTLRSNKRQFLGWVDRSSHETGKLQTSLLRAARLAVPPIPEQTKIAEILSTWDEAIDQTRRLLDAKKKRKKALMQQLLSGKKRLLGFKKAWRKYFVGDVLKDVNRCVDLSDDTRYRLVSIRRRSGGFFDRETRLGRDIGYTKLKSINTGDFVIARRQVIHGAMAMAPPDFEGAFVSDAYATLIPRDPRRLHMPFFDYLSRTPQMYNKAYRCSYGVAIEKLFFNLKWFLSESIVIPDSFSEQKAIAEVLTGSGQEISTLEQKLAALEKQKRGFMQKLLTGTIRVKV